MPLTTDPTDPRLGHGVDTEPGPQNELYLVLSDEEKAKGFVRPVRRSYIHIGAPGPKYFLRDLSPDEIGVWGGDYIKFEVYPESELPKTGKFWTQQQLDNIGKGCKVVTTMDLSIAETYARMPRFYGGTYCTGCKMHLPVDEFIWFSDHTVVGS